MSKMVERVAKAMAEELDDLDVRGLHLAAREAIAAMREPTTEMINAAQCEWPAYLRVVPSEALVGVWQAMIDEMLK